ncbi:adenylate kinase [Haloferula luteola]|uniref:Adenylate kinase n=1 Tax=Haloferula luteola TaxID=595692 RepID=A0A840UZH3_9BACT|nr:nucleoside monophosphate kinase [Haloferula luteola]MBB5351145.1 adenylate kinase [Haloferula luteola]
MPLRLILLGPPASGKGTQGRRIAEREGLAYLSTGALLREALEQGGTLSEEIRPILARGGYIADGTMCQILEPWLQTHHATGWVLDGFPRTLVQDNFLRDWLAKVDCEVDAAVALDVPKEDLIARIHDRVECPDCRWSGRRCDSVAGRCPKCGGPAGPRADDDLDNFLHRFDEFVLHAVPVIERYAGLDRLIRAEATGGIEVVADGIREQIQRFIQDGQEA